MGMRIDNRFKYFKDINEALKRKYQTTEDFPYSQMANAIDNIPTGAEITDVEINSEGHLIVTFSDGTTMDAGYIGIPTVSIATANVTLSTANYTYDGTSKLPTVQRVVLDDVLLVELQDYVIISNSEINAGSYVILIQGTGNYSGIASANWTITKAQATISGADSISVTGIGESESETYTTTGDGAMSFSISDSSVATISSSGGQVTVTGVSAGSATLTVTVADGTNYLGTSKTASIAVTEASTDTVFGVMWDYSLNSPVLTRLTPQTDPLGVVTTVPLQEPTVCVGNDGNGQSDLDNYMPWAGMQRYNYVNGQIVDFVDYSNGETFVYIPEFWSKIVDDSVDSKMYFYISSAELSGFTKHPGSGRYIARYPCDVNFLSRPNGLPKTNTSLGGFRTGITDIDNKHFQFDIHTYMARNLLYLVEFADFNSQAEIGAGITGSSSAHVSGETDILIHHTGRINSNDGSVQYRWIENLWGNIYELIDGVLIDSGVVYICDDKNSYSDTITNDYKRIGLTIPIGDNWCKTDNCYDNCYLIPAETGGSATTYTCDYCSCTSGVHSVIIGGDFSSSLKAGLFNWSATAPPNHLSVYRGSRSILILGGDS